MKKRLFMTSVVIILFFFLPLLFPGKKNLVLAECNCGACVCITWTNPWGGCGGSCTATGGCGTVGCLLSPCNECGGGCFTAETKIATPGGDSSTDSTSSLQAGSGQGNPSINSGQVEIKDVKEGDVVKSFNPETGEIKEATVSDVHKKQVSGYYVLKTESGKEIKATGEHPFLAIKQETRIMNNESGLRPESFDPELKTEGLRPREIMGKIGWWFKGVWERVQEVF